MVSQSEHQVKHIADIVGEWGKWQFHLFIFQFLLSAVAAFINMGYSFHAKSVDFWCSDVPQEYLYLANNITNELQCSKYSNPEEVCNQWTYNTTQYKKSIITEFDLVCDRSNYASLSQSIFMLGYVVSGLVVSHFSDKYGRKPMAIICYSIEIIGIISCGLSVNITQYIISRFMVGLGHSGGGSAVYTIMLECCGPKHRSSIIILSGLGWILGNVTLPGFAYLLQDFRYMQLISVIPIIIMLIWLWFRYESPRWQLVNGMPEKAEQTIRKALLLNGKSTHNLSEDMKKLTQNLNINKQGDLEKSHNMLDLLRTSKLRKYSFVIWFSSIVNALIYYGFSLNMSNFGGNLYITFLLSGVVEVPNQLITPLLLKIFGRKTLYTFFTFVLAISSFAVIPSKAEWLKVMFALIGKYAVTTSWSVLGIQSSEIYPTVIRNTGIGVISVVARIGSMSAPFMGNLAKNTSLSLVMALYGVLSLISGLSALVLTETKDREIPDTIEEIEKFDSFELKIIDSNKS